MLKLFSALMCASLLIQGLNYLFVKWGSNGNEMLWSNFKLIVLTLPMQIMVSLFFVYFYNHGVKSQIPYFYLSLMSIASSMIFSWLVNLFFINGRLPTSIEWLACFFTMAGIGLFAYAKTQVGSS